ncbi:hypothetical protein WJX73_005135 [Symbiochloris irregularis]|uniref:CRAL-TRIO domain-containing protein n=1 Tax=Symbiochloris irregularis TaxID=706552 RepID=A0AAW1P8U7_9CHLO
MTSLPCRIAPPWLALTCSAGAIFSLELLAARASQDLREARDAPTHSAASASQSQAEATTLIPRSFLLRHVSAANARSAAKAETSLAFSSPWSRWRQRWGKDSQERSSQDSASPAGSPAVVEAHTMAERHHRELQEAETAQERQQAIEKTAQRASATASWLATHNFMTEDQLQQWQYLAQWRGTDSQDQPILLLTPARALSRAKAPPLEQCAEAIVSQVYHGIHHRVDNTAQASGMMVVVVDARGVSGMQVVQLVRLIKEVALTLNAHFPGRLAALWLVDCPSSRCEPKAEVLLKTNAAGLSV